MDCVDCVKMAVDVDGLYRVTYEDLDALSGFDPDAYDPRRLHLYLRGEEIAMDVRGEADEEALGVRMIGGGR